jgi:aldose sugar dehydrogenase
VYIRVAPSELPFVEGSQFASWNGGFLLGALNPQHLLRYDPTTDETEILRNVGRVRDIAQLPSGKLLIAVDAGARSRRIADESSSCRLDSSRR